MTRKGTLKYQNAQSNSRAAITIADDEAQTSVQAVGNISEVPIGGQMDAIFTKLAALKTPGEKLWAPPVSKIEAGESVLLRLTPDSLQLADFHSHHTDPANYIQQII